MTEDVSARASPSPTWTRDAERHLSHLWQQGQRPDVHLFLATAGPLSLAEVAAVLAVDQRQRWQAGERVLAEAYLQHYPALQADAERALELVYGELLLREELGEAPVLAEYQQRFPQYAARLEQQVALHQALRAGPTVIPPVNEAGFLPRPTAPLAPLAIPGYEVLEELGRGGMGVVYKAVQLGLNRPVALKMLLNGAWTSPADVQRFRLEAEAIAHLDHPNIIPVYEVGVQEGRHFISLKLVEGSSLAEHLAERAGKPRAVVQLLAMVARAVHYAHQRGIIHRDLKPANILLDADQHPYVTDFGLAKRTAGESGMTQTGAIVGTPSYMAPEQATGQKTLTTAVDVYALGAILYEVLTGRPPFCAATTLETVLQVLEGNPRRPRSVNPTADPELEAVSLKCLAKDPGQRYASAADLAADLEHWLAREPLSVRPPRLASLLRLWVRQNFGSGAWVVILGLAWGLFCGVFVWLVMINPLGMSDGLRATLYLFGVGMVSSAGLMIAALVRPRNTTADLAAGTIAGLLAAVTSYTISWGWVAVLLALRWGGTAAIPYGIWLGMSSVLVLFGLVFVIETLAAGSLLRRHERVRPMIGSYFELVIPATLLVLLGSAVSGRIVIGELSRYRWLLVVIPLLALAVTGVLRRWHWMLRACLHAAWLGALCFWVVVNKSWH